MLGTNVAEISGLYTSDDVERFLQASGEILLESFRFRTSGKGSVTGSLAVKKLASHKRLVIPSVQVCREGSNWMVTTDPLFNPVWAAGGQSLATALLAVLQATEEDLLHSGECTGHLSVRTRFPTVPSEEQRVVFNETSLSAVEQILRWSQQAQRFVEGKRVLDLAGGGGISSKMLSSWAQECLCVDWDPISLQIAFETFSAPNIVHYWLPSLPDLPTLLREQRPDVVCWFQALEPERMPYIALAMTEEMQLVMPREFSLVTMAESLFESVRAFADLLVCRLPKRDAFPKNLSLSHPYEQAQRWLSSTWQMRLPRNTLPIAVNDVLGYATPEDVFALHNAVVHIPSDEPTVVEIGSFTGLSACIFSHSLRRHGLGGKVYCVDLWDTYAERNPSAQETGFFAYKSGQLRQLFDHYISTAGATQVIPICEDSTRAWKNFADGSIDLLFIDGDHSYEGCLADLSHWYPKVKPDGVILGHDYDWDTVRAAAQDFSRQRGFRLQEMAGGTVFLLLMPQASAYPQRELVPLELNVTSCV
ncbi:MAG: hypothetical protein KatS3mg023_1437 [Armatimonadota bacterium]|nr:MAG: hypothetical protein KatS3mg023_1437 [Armatimonadota bacterium]